MGQKQPPNPAQIAVFAVLAVAKATVHKVRGKPEPKSSRSRSLARQFTSEEMEPLHEARRIQSMRGRPEPPPSKMAAAGAVLAPAVKLMLLVAAAVIAGMHEQWPIVILCSLAFLLEAMQAAFTLGRYTAVTSATRKAPAKTEAKKEGKEAPKGGKEAQDGAQDRGEHEAAPGTPPNKKLSGTWHKVDHLSESQDEAAKLMKIGGLAKNAMKMFKGMNFTVTDTHISSSAIIKLPFFKAPTETYAFDGSISSYPRRDMRKGEFNGYVKVQDDGGVNLYYSFDEPLAGHCCDEIRLVNDDELHITTHLTIGEESTAYKVVYYRAGSELARSGSRASSASSSQSLPQDGAKDGAKDSAKAGREDSASSKDDGSGDSTVSVTAAAAKVTVVSDGKEQPGQQGSDGGLLGNLSGLVGNLAGGLGGVIAGGGQQKEQRIEGVEEKGRVKDVKDRSRRSSAMQSEASSDEVSIPTPTIGSGSPKEGEEVSGNRPQGAGRSPERRRDRASCPADTGSAYSSGTEGGGSRRRRSAAAAHASRGASGGERRRRRRDDDLGRVSILESDRSSIDEPAKQSSSAKKSSHPSTRSSLDDPSRRSHLAPHHSLPPQSPPATAPATPSRGIVAMAGSLAQAVGGVVGGVVGGGGKSPAPSQTGTPKAGTASPFAEPVVQQAAT